jgi:PAS domain S-box-containing protein
MADDAAGRSRVDSAVLDALLGHLPQGFVFLDLDTRIVRLSTFFATRLATTPAELIGRPLSDVVPALAEALAAARERVLARGESLLDVELFGIGGATRWSSNWHPVRDGAQRIVGIAILVTFMPDKVEAVEQHGSEPKHEALLRLALQSADAGIWQTDLVTGENTWGEGMAEMLGVPPERAAIESRRWPDYLYEGDKERVQREFLSLYERGPGQPWSIDFRARRFDGVLRWFSSRAVVVNEPDGGPKLIGMTQDITERKQVEQALEESESTLRSFYESSPLLMGVVEVNEDDGDIIHIYDSPATALFFEREADSAGNASARALGVPDEVIQRWVASYRASERGIAPIRFEYVHESSQGKLWLACVVAFIGRATSGRSRFSYVAADVTEQKTAEQALRASEERFRSVFEHAGTGVAIVDFDYRFQRCNPAFERIVGYRESELLALPLPELIHPEDRQGNVAQLERMRSQGTPCFEIENRYLRKGGEPVWVQKFVSRMPEEPGKPGCYLALVTDVTERKRAEAVLREADKRKNEFLATLAHELRNPLAPIRNAVHLLGQPFGPEAASRARELIDRQVSHMVRLIDDLLDIGRISSGKLELRRERVALTTVIEQAIETALPHMHGRSFNDSLPAEPIYLDADPVRIAQLFSNLLNNACKYTDVGGNIWLEVEREAGHVLVRVRDDGIGIASEHLPGLFEMFSQVAPALSRSQGGLGIGLSLVRGLVEMHCGSVSARSDGPGRGSEFTVRLPTADSASAAHTSRAEQAPLPTEPSRRVLVVDDNYDSAESLGMLLEMSGNVVEMAHDGLEAVQKSASFRPELILLDLGLPKLNGYDACRAIRKQPWGNDILIAALTGWGQEEDRDRSKQAGFDLHLLKPIAPEALFRLIRELDSHSSRTRM